MALDSLDAHAGEQREETEVSSWEVCKKYRKISRFRPPFEYQPNPSYQEADETQLFEIERRVFDINSYPQTPVNSEFAEHRQQLVRAHKELTESINDIRRCDNLHQKDVPQAIQAALIVQVATTLATDESEATQIREMNADFDAEKALWETHYKKKKLFFHQAVAYTLLLGHHRNDSDVAYSTRRLQREVHSMFIGHQATTYARSASHELGPLRRDRSPTILHPYRVCVHGMNFWLKKIQAAKTEPEEIQLFEELNMEIIRDLFHDIMEDYYLTMDDLEAKMIEMVNLDFRVLTPMRHTDDAVRDLPPNINFVKAHKERIRAELWALTKEEEDRRNGAPFYLTRKMTMLNRNAHPTVFLSKVRDRNNNLRYPKYSRRGQTLMKLRETLEIFELGWSVYFDLSGALVTTDEFITEMNNLLVVCEEQLLAYEQTEEYSVLCEENGYWKNLFEFTQESLLDIRKALNGMTQKRGPADPLF